MLHNRFNKIALAGFVAVATATSGSASTVQTTMPVTALNLASCVVTALPLAFGSINQVAGAAIDSQTTVIVTCTPGISYNVGLDNGTHAASGVRRIQSLTSSATIPYAVYSDAARSTAWGTTVGTDTVAQTAQLLPTTLTVYGRIPAGATLVAAGAYSDLVTVTVTF